MRSIEAAILAPDVSGIVICGHQGVGKSRIAREAVSSAATRGSEARWTIATSSARSVPLGAFAAWTQFDVTDTGQLLRGVIDALTAAPAGVQVVIGVDDAHLLDDLSTFVVHQIVQRGAAKVVLTVRDDAPIPAAVQEIWKAGSFDWLDLRPVSLASTSALLAATLGALIEPVAAQRLWSLTRGNLLYLRNIVEQEVADGRIVRQDRRWRWLGDPIMPSSLVELVESRIGALPTGTGDVIDALAVGEPIELAALTRITSPAAIEEADTSGLITLEPVGDGIDVRLAHPLYGEVRRRRAPATRLRRLRAMVAAELAASEHHDDIPVLVRRAALSIDSDVPLDGELLASAARGAVWLADLPLADRLARAATRAGMGPEPNFVRAHALSWLGRGAEADAVLTSIPTDELSDDDRARLAFLRASNLLWALGDSTRAKEVIDEAARSTPPHVHTYIDAFLTAYWFAMDRPDAAIEASKSLALEDLPGVVGAEIAWSVAAISGDAGRTADAIAAAEAGYAAATRSFDAPQMRFNIADAHVGSLVLAGRIAEACDVAERARTQAADLPGAAQLLGTAVAGLAELGAGRLDTACSLLEQAAVGLTESGHAAGWGYRYHLPWVTALAMRGSADEATAALATLDDVHRTFRALDYEKSLAQAWVTACRGTVSVACATALAAAERASAKGQFGAEVLCLQTAVQFGDRSSTHRLRELETIVEGPRVGLVSRFAQALRDGDGSELLAVSEGFERSGDLIAAIDAAAHAAVAYRRHDLRGSALGCAARAEALAERCGGASTPALRDAAEPLPLTDREREIVALIGDGLSNRDVAARLTLSVRTVESHIYRAMSKTGATNRDELAALRLRR